MRVARSLAASGLQRLELATNERKAGTGDLDVGMRGFEVRQQLGALCVECLPACRECFFVIAQRHRGACQRRLELFDRGEESSLLLMRVRDLRLQPIPGGPGLLCIVEPGFELFKEPCALRRSLRFNRGEGGTGTRCVPVEPLDLGAGGFERSQQSGALGSGLCLERCDAPRAD